MLALQSLIHSKSFILSQDLSELITSITNVQVNPLDLSLASLAQLSFVRSAAISISISHSSNFVESYSLKTAMFHSNELVRFVCFCVVHKVSVYWCITHPKGSVGVGEGGGWRASERFCSSHSMQSKLSADCHSPASSHWHKSFISLVSAVNLVWLPYIVSLGWPSASGPPKATAASEPWVLSLLLSMPVVSESSTLRLMSLSKEHPALLWWVALLCI